MAQPKTVKDAMLAREQWQRYQDGLINGHQDYQKQAKLNEDFYLGGGRQWSDEDKKSLESVGKPWLEENIIFSTINTILGNQTQSRMDIAYKPRDIVDQETSDVLTKVGMFIVDQNKFPWKESQVFADGVIQQRGYFEIKMDFTDNFFGEIKIDTLDPLTVIPDPEANEYDPDTWKDVTTTRWVHMDDIKETYGLAKFRKVALSFDNEVGLVDHTDEETNNFGEGRNNIGFFKDKHGREHVRLIDRQYWKLSMRSFWFDPASGEVEEVPLDMKPSLAKKLARETEREITKRLVKKVRWTVSTKDAVLHDEWSPYDHFTIVPYFPYFRRGVTIGVVDNLIKTQEMINKTYSQMLHVVNTTANSGWVIEEDSLVNIDVEDLEEEGSKTGLVLEHKKGSAKPDKIQPNQIPTGLKDIVSTSVDLMRMISGVSESFQGGQGNEVSGVAIQSRVQQSAVQLATPIDNLFRTRNMMALRLLKLMQKFMTDERVFLITSDNPNEPPEQVGVNQEDEEGNTINDITSGKYDIVIADVPTQITFENAQFAQALEMRKFGIEVPDDEMILMSTLSRKQDIAKKLSGEVSEEEQARLDEQQQLELETMRGTVAKLEAEAAKKDQEAAKQAAEIALLVKQNPGLGLQIDQALSKPETQVPVEQLPEQSEQGLDAILAGAPEQQGPQPAASDFGLPEEI